MIIQDTFATLVFIFLFWISGSSLQYFVGIQASKTIKNISAVYMGLYFYTLLFIFLGLIQKLTLTYLVITSVLANVFFILVILLKFKIQWRITNIFQAGKNKGIYLFHISAGILVYRNALFPIDGFDALAYHLYAPYSALYHTHTFDASNPIPNSGLPIGTDAIYGLLSLIGTPQAASLFNVFYVITALIIVSQILRNRSLLIQMYSLVSIFSLFIILGPIFSEPGTDLPLIGVGLLILSLYLEKENNSSNDFFGPKDTTIHIFLGLMVFTKPSVLIFVGTLWIARVYLSSSRRKSVLQIIKVAPITLAPIVIWFTKNLLQTGNPVIPFGTHIFKSEGYGPEVMTTDSDIRSSFQQVFRILTNKDSYKFIADFTATQNTTVLISVFFTSLLLYSFKYFLAGCRDSFLITIVVSEILTFLFSGPIFRYFGYLLSMHLVLIIQISRNKKVTYVQKANLAKNYSGIPRDIKLFTFLFFVSLFGVLNLTNTRWNVDDSAPLTKVSRISSGSTEANQVIMHIKKEVNPNANVCLVGDSRAMLFWPSRISFLQSNRINPFADPGVFTNDQAIVRLKELNCDYLVLTSVWGFPSNVNLLKIKDFASSSQAMISNNYYSVYDVGSLKGKGS